MKSRFKSFRPAIHGLKALEIFKTGLHQSFLKLNLSSLFSAYRHFYTRNTIF